MGLTTAPLDLWWLAWGAMVPLWWLLLWPQISPRRLAGLAALWGVGYHGTALSWLRGLHPLTWLGISWWGSLAITAFAWCFVTAWGAGLVSLWALAVSRLQRRLGQLGVIWLGTALWCGLERLRSLTPLDWTSLAYTQSPDNLAILHLGQLSGPLTVTAAIVAVNGGLAAASLPVLVRLTAPQSRQPLTAGLGRLGMTVALFSLLHLTGFLLYQWPLAEPAAAALQVGIIQGNIPTREKLTSQGVQQSRSLYLQGYRQLAATGADAVLTPEGALPTYWDTASGSGRLFQRAVDTGGSVLWLGTFVRESGDRITQSLLTLMPGAAEPDARGRYNKIKLVPLGEYIPLQAVLGSLINRLSPIEVGMIPGSPDQQFESGFGPAAVGICYDSAYSWLFRRQVARGGQFILTTANNDPYPPRMMAQHHAQDVMRAIETDRWAVRATNTGLSGVVDPHGHTRWLSVPNQYVTHIATIYRRHTRTLYVRWGDWLTPLLLGLSLIWAISVRLSQR
jgi:apolipoprotein N-acyltransferase